MSYPVPLDQVEIEHLVKKSRFIGVAQKVTSREEALAVVSSLRARFPDARHYCWAYLIGDPSAAASAAANDDGEPSGTAGKPILNVLQHKGIGDVMVVVVRYFGGIKLGAGGLVRAYSHTAELAMSGLKTHTQVRHEQYRVCLDFAHEQIFRHWLFEHQGELIDVDYGNQVSLHVGIPSAHSDAWVRWCEQHQYETHQLSDGIAS